MPKAEQNLLVLQGGGALGAYQAGAYQTLSESSFAPDWVAGISIGAINAAIICGNPVELRMERLRAFWEEVTSDLTVKPFSWGTKSRRTFSELAAAEVTIAGVPGFFRPRVPMALWPFSADPALSFYDTTPLEGTLGELIDLDYLNEEGPRLSVGATDIETGNFIYFDSEKMRLDLRHIMASGALPPGFPPVEIDGRFYWDGGLVSNTPLQYVMENAGADTLCIFQIDLFNARGEVPGDIADVQQREKDIRFSSRTRLTTDRFKHLHDLRAAAERLVEKLPKDMQSDPDLALLRNASPACPITLVHLIHRKEGFESNSKDYEFSRLSMTEHWAAGVDDVKRTLAHRKWKSREIGKDGLQVFDLSSSNA
ncbi:patatin-like phospholipase family protein [Roseibium sp. FZY0029]|uniref:patatin-like phospholipase family protein n=1 Tax=Roseibium sp. FZY0029 TaxID=3116647 RepID=UPI002EB4B411|nr:patatin-like phospholipase family protein [Roseibium sp. FZY0029]